MAAKGFKYLSQAQVDTYKAYGLSDKEIRKNYDLPENAPQQATTTGTPYRKGGHLWKEEDILAWQQKLSKNVGKKSGWTEEQVKDLQIKLGVRPTGKYDPETAAEHQKYFQIQGLYGYEAAQRMLQQNKREYLKGKEDWQQAEYEARNQLVTERRAIKDSMFTFYQNYFGYAPSKGTMADLVAKRERGWGFDELDRQFRANPEFKRKHPGITNNVSLEEYDEIRNKIFSNFIATRGRPPKPHEIADVLAGRAKPIAGSFGDMPSFNINPNLGGI